MTAPSRLLEVEPLSAALARVAEGTEWSEAGIPGIPIETVHDIRSYYEELCLELADTSPQAWASEHWFYEETEAGKTILAARWAMKEAGVVQPLWFYLAPATRPNPD